MQNKVVYEEITDMDKNKRILAETIATGICNARLNGKGYVMDNRTKACYEALALCDQLDVDNMAAQRASFMYNVYVKPKKEGAIIAKVFWAIAILLLLWCIFGHNLYASAMIEVTETGNLKVIDNYVVATGRYTRKDYVDYFNKNKGKVLFYGDNKYADILTQTGLHDSHFTIDQELFLAEMLKLDAPYDVTHDDEYTCLDKAIIFESIIRQHFPKYKTRFVYIKNPNVDGFVHINVELYIKGKWIPYETTSTYETDPHKTRAPRLYWSNNKWDTQYTKIVTWENIRDWWL